MDNFSFIQYKTFLYCSPFSYRPSKFSIAKLSLLIPLLCFVDWFMASFLYCFPYSYRSSNFCDSNSCRSFTFLKAIAKSKSTYIAIAFKCEKEQYFNFTLHYRKVGRALTKWGVIEKSQILLSQYWKNSQFELTYPISPFN